MRSLLTIAACYLFAGAPVHAQPASTEQVSESGLQRTFFRVPQGTIRLNLPDDVAAGDTVFGTVYTEPSGKDQNERDKNAAALASYSISMEGRADFSSNRLRWSVPSRVGDSAILLIDRSKKTVARGTLPVGPMAATQDPFGFDLPLSGQAGSFVSIWASLPDDADAAVTVGGKEAAVIAKSARKIVFISPPEVVGLTTLEVKAGPSSAKGPFRALGLRISASENELRSGQTAILTALASGLTSITEPALLLLGNRYPGVVAMAGGALQQVVIKPQDVRPDGTFQTTTTITGERDGGFTISGVLTLRPTSQLPLQSITRRAIDRWSRSNAIDMPADARSLIAADVDAARSRLDDFFLAQLAFRSDLGTLLDSMVRDYCFSLRDIKLKGRVGRLDSPRIVRLANAFAPQAPAPAASITASDVRANSFLKYLGQLLDRLTPSQAVGGLVVMSQPDRQPITIGRLTGMDFLTTRSFVLTAGDYNVAVATCNEVVKVRANQKTTFTCTRR